MALETAIRNPERYFSILGALVQFEGLVLNDENLLTIVAEMYKQELVGSGDVGLSQNDHEIKEQIVKVNSSRNADGGFPRGYASRFWTYMRTPSEFGFVYARYNKVFQISPIVKKVLNGELDEQEAFALQAFRGNRRSPYRNVSNDFNFFKFIFQVLKRREDAGHMLSMEQFTLAMFSYDGDVDKCVDEIEGNIFSSSDDVFNYLKARYGISTKIQTVTRDYPDVVVRMLLITGMISIKYTGVKLIGLNKNKIDFFNELLDSTPKISNDAKESDELLFEELNEGTDVYSEIVEDAREVDVIEGSEYTSKLLALISQYSLTQSVIITELEGLSRNSSTLFKEMSAPLKLEFYIALIIASVYGEDLEIRPNYKADHEGKPYSHAPGGGGDIDVFNDGLYWLIEVTLIQNRQQQLNSETTTVFRHMTTNTEFSDRTEKYLSFVAPYVHDDTQDYFEVATFRNRSSGINFGSYNIREFVDVTKNKDNFSNMKNQTKLILDKVLAES